MPSSWAVDVVCLEVIAHVLLQGSSGCGIWTVDHIEVIPLLVAIGGDEGGCRQFSGARDSRQVEAELIVGSADETVIACGWSSKVTAPCLTVIASIDVSFPQLCSESYLKWLSKGRKVIGSDCSDQTI